MDIILYGFLFIAGLIIGFMLFNIIIFPVFYVFPKSISYSIKGDIKPIAILVSLRTPAVVLLVLVMLDIFFPNILLYLEKPSIYNGSNIAITLLCIRYFVFKSGRNKLHANFWVSLFRYRIGDKWMEIEQ